MLFGSRNQMTIEVEEYHTTFLMVAHISFYKSVSHYSEIEPSCRASQILAELKINCVSHYFRNRAFNAHAC